ncbi:MAG: ATP-binding protein [Candidatus Woesearchaeota archaeon]
MEKYVERELDTEITKYIKAKEIIAIVGTRQCGKTTLVNNLLDKLEKRGKKTSRIAFDNLRVLQLFENDTDSFVDLYVKDFDILFIDEVHYSKDSGKKLKYIYDNFDIKIFISGSSAAEISIHSLKYLVGRIFTFTLYPFSFKEFLSVKDPRMVDIYCKGTYKKEIVVSFNRYLEEFILYGGYPRVVLSQKIEEKKKVLDNIYNTYLLKEIREIFDLSEDYQLISLLKALSLQIGNIVNYNELSSLSGFTYFELKKYLNILEKTYVCSLIKPFFTNKRTELVKNPKIYFFDLGFRNVCIGNFSNERVDKGSLYENFIFSELIKKGIRPKYWNTKSSAEVDYILEEENKLIPVELKSSIKEEKITKSFNSFISKYKPNKGYFLSLEFESKRRFNNCMVNFLPFVKFINKL